MKDWSFKLTFRRARTYLKPRLVTPGICLGIEVGERRGVTIATRRSRWCRTWAQRRLRRLDLWLEPALRCCSCRRGVALSCPAET